MDLFPEFSKYAEQENLTKTKLSGNLDATIPRILGQGKTKADGLDLPPSPMERKMEYIRLSLPPPFLLPEGVKREIEQTRNDLETEIASVSSIEGSRLLARKVLNTLNVSDGLNTGIKSDIFFADGLILVPNKTRLNWSWSITSYYPIIEKIPPEYDYLLRAFYIAREKLKAMIVAPERFQKQLESCFALAKMNGMDSNKILLSLVAKMYQVVAQDTKFWNDPQKRNFSDIPESSFISNLFNYLRSGIKRTFEFQPAALNDSYQKNIYYIPQNNEGTEVRPYVYINKTGEPN